MRRYVNIFSTPARRILDELFGPYSLRERPSFPTLPTETLARVSLSQKAPCIVRRDGEESRTFPRFLYARRGPIVAVMRLRNLRQ